MDDLDALIAAVERGSGLDERVAIKATGRGDLVWKAFHGSIDAAQALHDALIPGWDIQISTYEDDSFEASVSDPRCVKTYDGVSHWIAPAWLLAVLKAKRAKGETE